MKEKDHAVTQMTKQVSVVFCATRRAPWKALLRGLPLPKPKRPSTEPSDPQARPNALESKFKLAPSAFRLGNRTTHTAKRTTRNTAVGITTSP